MSEGQTTEHPRAASQRTVLRETDQHDVAVLALQSPILSQRLLTDLHRTLLDARRLPLPLVVVSDHPRIFLAGAHLAEIAALNRFSSGAYAARGREVLNALGSHPAPVIAAVHGVCAGGGFDLAMACDTIVAGTRARFSHPGVHRGLVTGWGGTAELPHSLGGARARHALVAAAELDTSSLAAPSILTSPSDSPLQAALGEARRMSYLEPFRLHLWRCLRRGRFIDRFRAVVVHNQCRYERVSFSIRRS